MRHHLGPLRVRMAIAGFVAIYAPVVVLVMLTLTAQELQNVDTNAFSTTTSSATSVNWMLTVATALITAPIAAFLSWWWSGKALKPITEAVAIQEQLVEETSHELRNPLSVLMNNAEVLLEHPNPTAEEYRAGMSTSLRAAQKMRTTIDSLLVDARGRARSIVLRPTDISRLATQVVDDLAHSAALSGVSLTCHAATAERARVDAASVERALANLLTNAIKAAPAASEVSVAVHPTESEVRVSVTDHGPGIPEEDQPFVFDRFWHRAGDDEDGFGIGLSIVQQVAQAHGGEASVESPVLDGRGSQFYLSLQR